MDKILHYLKDPKLWGIMVYSLLWVMQDFVHQPYFGDFGSRLWNDVLSGDWGYRASGFGFKGIANPATSSVSLTHATH